MTQFQCQASFFFFSVQCSGQVSRMTEQSTFSQWWQQRPWLRAKFSPTKMQWRKTLVMYLSKQWSRWLKITKPENIGLWLNEQNFRTVSKQSWAYGAPNESIIQIANWTSTTRLVSARSWQYVNMGSILLGDIHTSSELGWCAFTTCSCKYSSLAFQKDWFHLSFSTSWPGGSILYRITNCLW